jgi:hypothetical protein
MRTKQRQKVSTLMNTPKTPSKAELVRRMTKLDIRAKECGFDLNHLRACDVGLLLTEQWILLIWDVNPMLKRVHGVCPTVIPLEELYGISPKTSP